MKIVLFALNGSYSHTCLAVYCLRQALEKKGYAPRILETNLRDRRDEILQSLYEEHADLYSFSCYIWNIREMLSLAEDLKQLLPKAIIVFGGPEASYGTERFVDLSYIDHVVCGEGEELICEICSSYREGIVPNKLMHCRNNAELSDMGILYRDGDLHEGKILYYESSRGCPYSCAYCLSSAERGVRMKSVEQTLADLLAFESLHADVPIIKFVDRTFNCDQTRANRIWEALTASKFTKKYHFEICASLLDEDSFSVLSHMPKGKIQLEIGLQSTNGQTLSAVARHIDSAQVIESTSRIYAMGNIHVHLDLIAGLPHEDYQSFQRSFNSAYYACDMLQLGFLKLLHGTALRNTSNEYGIVFSQQPPYTVLQTPWITKDELHRLSEIADLLERYASSGRFAQCLAFAVPHAESPFSFYNGLLSYLYQSDGRSIRKLSQADAFRSLYGYCTRLMPSEELSKFEAFMHEDFTLHEARRLPRSVLKV